MPEEDWIAALRLKYPQRQGEGFHEWKRRALTEQLTSALPEIKDEAARSAISAIAALGAFS